MNRNWSPFCVPLSNYHVEQHGFAIVRRVLDNPARHELLSLLGLVAGVGRRGIMALPPVSALARSARLVAFVQPHLPSNPFPVRAIYFDKSTEANWLVSWHQDLTLALRARANYPGFGPWSTKDGIPHVQPPATLLEQMLTIRLHLDDADDSNGALRVLPGSHRLGRLSADHIQSLRKKQAHVLCEVSAGDAVLMRPRFRSLQKRTAPTHSAHRICGIHTAGRTPMARSG